jgi:hypothetical protein
LIITSVRLLSSWPSSLKNLSASIAVKSLSFVAPVLGYTQLPVSARSGARFEIASVVIAGGRISEMENR